MKLVVFILFCLHSFNFVHADRKDDEYSASNMIPKYQSECKFYLAESSIENAGFGIYTVESIKHDTYLTEVPDAPSIVVVDESFHSPEIVSNHWDYYW